MLRKNNYLNNRLNFSLMKYFSIYIFSSLVIGLIAFSLFTFGKFEKSWQIFNYSNPLIIASSIAFFSIFLKLGDGKQKNKVIDMFEKISKHILTIYLLTESTSNIRKYSYILVTNTARSNGLVAAIPVMLVNAIILFIFGILIDIILNKVYGFMLKLKIINSIKNKILNNSFWPSY